MIAHVPEFYKTSVVTIKYRRNATAFSAIESPIRSNDNDAVYCQIYCQIRGSEGTGEDEKTNKFSKLLILKMSPPGSNPSLSANILNCFPE
jgi:hypothetical protein